MRLNPNVKLGGDKNECAACGRLFRSTFAFDKHRVGYFSAPVKDGAQFPRRCMTEEEMRAAGMGINKRGFWVSELYEANQEWFEKEEDEALEQDQISI